jgi:RNA 3'-terminal phosphate cyclase (ATP)
MIHVDGAYGEGGGQLVRTALALAVARRVGVRLTGVRARRAKPGLQPQHLAAVRALAAIADADVEGDALGSTTLRFVPRALAGGVRHVDVAATRASAGSAALVFQAVLLPLAFAAGPSWLTIRGGTHVPWSPPVHYLTAVFLPALAEIGVRAAVELVRWGWYPAGGGEIRASVAPTARLVGLVAPSPGRAPVDALSAVSRLHRRIADRQLRRVEERLAAAGVPFVPRCEEDATAVGPGTLVFLAERARAGFASLGRRGVPAESIADEAVDALLDFRRSGAAVDEHLADQLLPYLALAEGESLLTCPCISSHLRTVAWLVPQLVPCRIDLEEGPPARLRVVPAPTTRDRAA